MAERLVDNVEKLDLSERNKLLMTMFPGILFGFVPSNYAELVKRLDCDICLAMARELKGIADARMPRDWRHRLLPWVRKAWKERANADATARLARMKELQKQDPEHWEDPDERNTSKVFINSFVMREDWVSL